MAVYGSTSYTPRAIDLDLFVNAASRGFQDGARVPSPFSSFVNSFFQGLDDSAKYQETLANIEQTNQQNEIRQIQIDEGVPEAEAQIKRAQGIEAQAKADVIEENQDLYKETQIAGLKAKAAEAERDAILQTKKTKLLEIWNSDDPVAKSNAVNSGEFNDLFGPDPKLREQYVKSTYKDWDDAGRDLYDKAEAIERSKKWNLEVEETVSKKNIEFEQAFLSDPNIQALKQQIGNNVSDTDMVEKGQMITIQAPPLVASQIKDPNNPKLLINEVDEFGNTIYKPDPNSLDKPVEKRVFRYDGKQYDLGTGISSDTYKNFYNYKTTYSIKNKLTPNSGGVTDLQISAQQQKDIQAKASAEANMNYEDNVARVNEYNKRFTEGAKVSPPYEAAAERVKGYFKERSANIERAAADPTAIPDLTYSPVETPKATSVSASKTPEAVMTPATPAPVITPAFTVTPGTANPIVRQSATPAPSVVAPTPSPDVEQSMLKKQMAKSKAQQIVNKYQQTNSPVPVQPTPVDQAREVTASSYIPTSFTVNVPSNYRSDTGIRRVANDPVLQGFSAITKAMIVQESKGVATAVSPKGVKGIAQVTEDTFKEIFPEEGDRTDPFESAMAGAIYLEKLMADPTFENNPMLAITAYNGGPGTVAKAIQMAGSTDWDVVKNYLEPAVLSMKWPKRIDPKQKAKEVREYAERVVANFDPFVYTRSDMSLAEKLKQQGVLGYGNAALRGA